MNKYDAKLSKLTSEQSKALANQMNKPTKGGNKAGNSTKKPPAKKK